MLARFSKVQDELVIIVPGDWDTDYMSFMVIFNLGILSETLEWDQSNVSKKQTHYFANKGLSSQSYGFSSGHVWMWELDCEEGLSPEELMLLNCGVGEDSWESLGLQGDPTSPS